MKTKWWSLLGFIVATAIVAPVIVGTDAEGGSTIRGLEPRGRVSGKVAVQAAVGAFVDRPRGGVLGMAHAEGDEVE